MASLSPTVSAQPKWQTFALARHDAAAVLGVCAIAVLGFGSSALAGLSFYPSLHMMLVMPFAAGMLALLYHLWRPNENRLFQVLLYVALWSLLPTAGTQLTFVASTANMPLQTELFAAADRALGFSWITWADFVRSRKWLEWITGNAYLSYAFQPYLALILITYFGSARRNAQLMIATMIALTITIAISALIPAVEPAHAYGLKTPAWEAHEALRAGQRDNLRYVRIICFPSFHTAMAVLFTAAYRGMPQFFWPAAVVNAIMLLSVPYSGDHYLIDMIGGLAVAAIAIKLAWQFVPEPPATRD